MYQDNYSQFDLAMEMLIANGFQAIAVLYAGANDYLTKTFDAWELRALVEVGRRMIEL
jgi:DNA-binding response OmpR family regulator